VTRTQPIKVSWPCDKAVREDNRHAGDLSVWLEAGDGTKRYYILGTGDDVQSAVLDAEEHAFAFLGDDASIFDWHAG